MKNTQIINLSALKTVLLLLTVTLSTSCKKKDGDRPADEQKPRISFVHAATGAPLLDLYFGTKKVSNDGFQYGSTIGYLEYGAAVQKLEVSLKGSYTLIGADYLTVKTGLSYSVFLTGSYPNLKFVTTEDDLKITDGSMAKIRFVHLSQDALDLDLVVNGEPITNFNSRSYREVTGYLTVAPSDTYNFELRESSSKKTVAKLGPLEIKKGKVYTICASGIKNGNEGAEQLKLSVIANN